MTEIKEKMNIICSQKSLLNGIQVVQRGISSKIGLPIYNGILFEAKDNKVHLFATDLEIGIDCYIPAQVIGKGSVVLPNKIIGDLVSKLPEGNIEIQNKEDFSTIIKQGNSKYKVLGYLAEEFSSFPEIEPISKIKLSQKILKEAIKKIIYAVSRDESRAFLNGGLFKAKDGKMEIVATDSHRLSLKKIGAENIQDCEVIVPYRTLAELQKLLSDQDDVFVEINLSEKQALFVLYPDKKNGIRIYSRLIEGEYPDYNQIIPKDSKTEIKVDTKDFMDKMERISIFTQDEVGTVKMGIKDNDIILSVESPSVGEASEKLECGKKGDDLEITFNSRYILDILKVIDSEKTKIKFSGDLSPVVVTPEEDKGYLCILMPVRSE